MSNGAATSFQPSQAQQQDAVLVPAGLLGSIVSALAPIVSRTVGGTAGNVIGAAGQFAHLIPFSAGPQMPQQGQQQAQDAVLVPQGLLGSIVGALAPLVGRAVGGTAGNVIGTAGQFAHLIPFSAGPQMPQQGQQQAQQQDAVLVPAGLIGSIVGALAPIVGQKVGGTAGNVISTAGQFAHLIPFNAGAQTVGTA